MGSPVPDISSAETTRWMMVVFQGVLLVCCRIADSRLLEPMSFFAHVVLLPRRQPA